MVSSYLPWQYLSVETLNLLAPNCKGNSMVDAYVSVVTPLRVTVYDSLPFRFNAMVFLDSFTF